MTKPLALVAALALAASLGAGGAAFAKPCHDAKGKFVACPAPAAAGAPKQVCKDAKGKFAKCGAPGAVPVKK